ncbi:hypothetical protein [Deinococcus peraridilitoris]|uniref:Phage capsid family protein n=1 Tax=Deinococcus peraridilitoris (strain DSM 19664 / LMG 22246 / CIP 109416 / KR-200) TaxID=937777 RepID=L0A0K6_DEIPD|nr:hypothetical protein [Deinococcus peraridilitoris]AFZ66989.1 hypothetical protein Deipe_1448 [Deinococcus peraridilitoris DSM 19664]
MAGNSFNPNDVHTKQTLTDFSVKYVNAEAIWRKLAPLKQVKKRSDKYTIFDKATAFEQSDDTTAPNADANEITLKTSEDNYSVKDHALGAWVPQEAVDEADDPIKPELDAVESIKQQLENRHEKRVADRLFVATAYLAGNKRTLAGTSQWSDFVNSDPIGDLTNEIENMIVRPTLLAIGADVWKILRRHPKVAAAIFPMGGNAQAGGTLTTLAQLAEVLELEEVVVGRARVNTANPGAAATLARAWGKHALLARVIANPGLNDVSLAVTFSESQSNIVRDFDGKKGVKGSVYVKDGWNEDVKVIASDAGFFFENAVA